MHRRVSFTALLVLLIVAGFTGTQGIADAQFAGQEHLPMARKQSERVIPPPATTLVSVAPDGTQANSDSSYDAAPSMSADGRFVAFASKATTLVADNGIGGPIHVLVHDRATRQNVRVSVASDGTQGNDDSFKPSLSSDGRFVAFVSEAMNLVAKDTNGYRDIFVHDRGGRP